MTVKIIKLQKTNPCLPLFNMHASDVNCSIPCSPKMCTIVIEIKTCESINNGLKVTFYRTLIMSYHRYDMDIVHIQNYNCLI